MFQSKNLLRAFLAGFFATLVFHQGLLAILNLAGIIPAAPFNMKPTAPFGVPAVFSLSFFGGLWGILIWWLIAKSSKAQYWLKSLVFGAIGPTTVAMLVVFPLKGVEVKPMMWLFGFILNGAWGLGVGLFMRLTSKFNTIK